MRCNGDGASSGADDGACEDSALNFVTLGWRCESVRTSPNAGVVLDLVTAGGFEQSSHSGSRSSRWSFRGSPGVVRPTTMVMESASDSKLWIEVGVMASCCSFRFMDACGCRVGVAVGF